MGKRGPKPKPKSLVVSAGVRVLLTPSELVAVRKTARAAGLTLSAWARAVLVRAAQGGYAPG